jgi:hypothetical protein
VPVPWIILVALLWLVVIVLTLMLLGLNQRLVILESSSSAASGTQNLLSGAPTAGALLPHHEQLLRPADSRGRSVLLFLNSGCEPCRAIAEELATVGEARSRILDAQDEVVVVTDAEGAASFDQLGRIVIDEQHEFMRALGINATPAGLSVDRNGIVCATTLLASADDVRRLAESCAGKPATQLADATANAARSSTAEHVNGR